MSLLLLFRFTRFLLLNDKLNINVNYLKNHKIVLNMWFFIWLCDFKSI